MKTYEAILKVISEFSDYQVAILMAGLEKGCEGCFSDDNADLCRELLCSIYQNAEKYTNSNLYEMYLDTQPQWSLYSSGSYRLRNMNRLNKLEKLMKRKGITENENP